MYYCQLLLPLSPDQCDPAELGSQCQLLCGGESRPAPIEEHHMLLLSKEDLQMSLHFLLHSLILGGWGGRQVCQQPVELMC